MSNDTFLAARQRGLFLPALFGWSLLALLLAKPLSAEKSAAHPAARAKSVSIDTYQAAKILRGALLCPQKLSFVGEQTVLSFAQGDGAASITRETHFGLNRHRIEYQNPPSARGNLLVADGKWEHLYLAANH